jgi:putative ABC transport system permease protein
VLFRTAFRNLFRNTRRTAAILITVAVGSASMFIFDGFNNGIMNQYRDNTIRSRYGHGQVNLKGYRDTVFEKPWEHWIENSQEIENSLLKTPGVKQVFPRVEFFALLTNGKITVSGRGQGVRGSEEAKFFNTINVEQGETLSGQPDGILLGKGLARALDAKPGDRITVLGNTVHGAINGLDLVVTGVFHTGSKDFDDVVFRVQLDQAQKLLDTNKVESIAIGLDQVSSWKGVADKVLAAFPTIEATPFAVLDKVYYQHSVDWLGSQFSVIQTIILIMVVLGIFNTVSTSILERKQEIGNLRANGESVADVMKLLLTEGAILGVIGSIAGLVVALLINNTLLQKGILMPPAPGITRQFHVRIELQPLMAVMVFVMGSATALIGSFLAGFRVAKLPIGEALRSV